MWNAEILAIGFELLVGRQAETNSLFLTDQLASLGIEVRFKSVVGDDEADIADAIRTAARRADVVVMTGGLGPTVDDVTREAVARITGCPLRRRARALESIKRRLAAWGRIPTPVQLRQALIPAGAEVLSNPVGSAPGFCLEWKGTFLVALPGVPAEARAMAAAEVLPRLQKRIAHRGGQKPPVPIGRRVLHTFGLSESEVDLRLKGVVPEDSSLRLGLQASPLGVLVSLTASSSATGAKRRQSSCPGHDVDVLASVFHEVRRRLGEFAFAEGEDTMEAVVGRLLADKQLTLAVAESCTGGLIGHRLTQVPGASSYLDRVVVSYSNRAKVELLGVPAKVIAKHGAVSAPVVAAMAKGVRERSRTAVGLSVTGIAGPGGGTATKPVGLIYTGLDWGEEACLTREFRFHGDREAIKLRSSQAALDLLRRWLLGLEAVHR
ncbi:MAG TPA: competence/damage-inducible protein A [Nitrospiraceae bacterium]|jgi:nicotinamide-nucleotide amidase|nr:competence/damage-inducible protein A [Nitrospiraceae bacterium]